MATVTNPRQHLGAWIKPAQIADQTHCILRFDGLLLVAYCGCLIPLKDASQPVRGARHCVNCESLRRKHLKERNAHVTARK